MEYELHRRFRNLALNLIELRKRSRLDQIQFAKKCGLSRSQYVRAESGLGSVRLQTVFQICEAFNVEVATLFREPYEEPLLGEIRTRIVTESGGLQAHARQHEEKFVSNLNRNIMIRKFKFKANHTRRIRLQRAVRIEMVVINGKIDLFSEVLSKTLTAGDHVAFDFNPRRSFKKNVTESLQLRSSGGCEFLLIQAIVD